MNYKMIINILGKVMLLEAFLLLFPFSVGFIYGELNTSGTTFVLSYLLPIAFLLVVGLPLSFLRLKDKTILAKEGFVIVALSWILLSIVGAFPFVIYGAIPNYINALFETVSGFSTTGASILSSVENLPQSIGFWRLFTHWIGGMGVLVFVLAILPNSGFGAMHIYRAESPGPTASKIVTKMKSTAKILYLIYFALTVIEFVFLVFDMPVFDAMVNAFATAGTGGFSIKNASIGAYNPYSQWVIAIFMFIFGINFNLFYLILVGRVLKAFKNEEFFTYCIIVFGTTIAITIINLLNNAVGSNNFGESLRNAFFQVTSLSSSTGFSTVNYENWSSICKTLLFFLMLFGACAGSTGGGMKISRLIILVKSSFADLKKTASPRSVVSVKFEGEPLEQDTIRGVKTYFIFWFMIVVLSTVIVSIGGYNGGECDILTSLSSSIACIGNIGPGFNLVGPAMNYGGLSAISKIWLSIVMLAGRLEIIPILILFSPKTWRKR